MSFLQTRDRLGRTTIYVAGASTEVDKIASYVAELRRAGLSITHDWTAQVQLARAAGKSDKDYTQGERNKFAWDDMHGVLSARFLWLVLPEVSARSVGAWVELGAAVASDKTIIVSGEHPSIFLEFATYRFKTHEEALKHLVEHQRMAV